MDFITKEPQGLGIPHRSIPAAQAQSDGGPRRTPDVPCGPASRPLLHR
jgi:hypothetical protein